MDSHPVQILAFFIYGTTIVRNFHDFYNKMNICKAFASQYVFPGNLRSEDVASERTECCKSCYTDLPLLHLVPF